MFALEGFGWEILWYLVMARHLNARQVTGTVRVLHLGYTAFVTQCTAHHILSSRHDGQPV